MLLPGKKLTGVCVLRRCREHAPHHRSLYAQATRPGAVTVRLASSREIRPESRGLYPIGPAASVGKALGERGCSFLRCLYNPLKNKRTYLVTLGVQTRAQDYFAGLEQLLRTMPPTEVSLHSAYTRSALRRVTGELRAKDLRKAIDALYKRVDKHFGGEVSNQAAGHTDVLKTVWKACEDEMVRLVTAWKGLIAKCYPVSRERVTLEKKRANLRWRGDL